MNTATPATSVWFDSWHAAIRASLDRVLNDAAGSERLQAAMKHAVLNGGKRMRPLLTLAAAHAAGGDALQALPAATLNRSRYLLLVFSDSKSATQALDDTVQNALDDAVQLLKATESTAAEAE